MTHLISSLMSAYFCRIKLKTTKIKTLLIQNNFQRKIKVVISQERYFVKNNLLLGETVLFSKITEI